MAFLTIEGGWLRVPKDSKRVTGVSCAEVHSDHGELRCFRRCYIRKIGVMKVWHGREVS